MNRELVKAIIVLPGTVLFIIPGVILLILQDSKFEPQIASPARIWFWLAFLAGSVGLVLSVWTTILFVKLGKGTPAPWDPPKKLIIQGPYHYVRNPMITGVVLILSAEALLLKSWPIAIWVTLFLIGNAIYFPPVEEKGLEKRFGNEYRNYKANVPRWIPRLRPWRQAKDDRALRMFGEDS
jgi:protein-S-isoprenylcysteine O-methyltransferase Ste14